MKNKDEENKRLWLKEYFEMKALTENNNPILSDNSIPPIGIENLLIVENNDIKIKCIKSIEAFKKGKVYRADRRSCINRDDKNDIQLIIIESSEGDMDNCYFMSLNKVYEHFSII